jgi:hypothetical protein
MSRGIHDDAKPKVSLADEPDLVPVIWEDKVRFSGLGWRVYPQHPVKPFRREAVLEWAWGRCTTAFHLLNSDKEVLIEGEHGVRMELDYLGSQVGQPLAPVQEPTGVDTNNLDFIVRCSSPKFAVNRILTASSTLRWSCRRMG